MLRLLPIAVSLLLPLTVLGQATPLPPEDAAKGVRVPDGFRVTPFAAEPDVVQPIAFTFDDRGRLWVVECLSYPIWKSEGPGSDRVTILEDIDGDGRHDKRTVFFDKGLNLSGIEVGFGGVWLTAVPELIFIPDRNGDDIPDGQPEVVLDGWDLKAKHNVVGNLAWGPDGWLYGCNGILSNSRVGKPGTPDARRTAMNCGVWRYHPTRQEFEVVAHGTTNPWGLDWDERGQLFITNCVIKHLFHVVPGARFVRMFGQDLNPHAYRLIESCADHQHWAGGHWTTSRGAEGAHGDAGGGHAHSGCMIYLGDNWPDAYRGRMLTCNIHGQRLNCDKLEPQDSTYVARHTADMAFWNDPFFRGVHVKYGADGGVYVSDWSDDGECHDYTEDDCIKTNGRIYKITFGEPRQPTPLDLSKLSDEQLVALQRHKNEWHARHARRLLQERNASRKLTKEGKQAIQDLVRALQQTDEPTGQPGANRLRGLMTAHVTGQLDQETLLELLRSSPDEVVRAHAALLATESRSPSPELVETLAEVASKDASPFVRLHVAAAAQRLTLARRWPVARALLTGAENTDDPYLALMTWYAVEPLVPHDARQAIEVLPQTTFPFVRQSLVRRLVSVYEAAGGDRGSAAWIMDALVGHLARNSARTDSNREPEGTITRDILRGLYAAYEGRSNVAPPAAWQRAGANTAADSTDAEALRLQTALNLIFGDRQTVDRELELLKNDRAPSERRQIALDLLLARREPQLLPILFTLIDANSLRREALRGLAAYDDPRIPARLLKHYASLSADEKQDAIATLTARPAYALALLGAIESGTIRRGDVSALVIRQLEALENENVTKRLKAVWGEIRPPSADKHERIAALKEQLGSEVLEQADLPRGRELFVKNCANCHRLFDEGSRIGPELTGSQRHNLDYVLDNVLDPSGIVPREYQVHVLRLKDGRVVQGLIANETAHTVVVQTATETVYVPLDDIEARKESSVSMMPEGLVDRLSMDELRDLVGYLASPTQVPLPRSQPAAN